jgi:hypothetical protein
MQLIHLAFLLKEKDRGDYLLTCSIELCRKPQPSCVISGMQLMTSLAQLMGKIMSEQFISMQLFSHMESENVEVKSTCVGCISIIAEFVSQKFIEERLIPIYTR